MNPEPEVVKVETLHPVALTEDEHALLRSLVEQEAKRLKETPTFKLGVEDALRELPIRIQRARRELWEKKVLREKLILEGKLVEADVASKVADEKGADGKALHSNAEKREARVRLILADHAGMRDLRARLDDTALVIDRIEASIECWQAMQRNARVLVLAKSPAETFFDADEW